MEMIICLLDATYFERDRHDVGRYDPHLRILPHDAPNRAKSSLDFPFPF